jgi:hypothetical protein
MMRLAEISGVWEGMSRAAAADVRDHFEHSAQIAKLEGFYDEALSTRPR